MGSGGLPQCDAPLVCDSGGDGCLRSEEATGSMHASAPKRIPQALALGATVAATVYVIYRVGVRRTWWRSVSHRGHRRGGSDPVKDDSNSGRAGFGKDGSSGRNGDGAAGDVGAPDQDDFKPTPQPSPMSDDGSCKGVSGDGEGDGAAAPHFAPFDIPDLSRGRDNSFKSESSSGSSTEEIIAEADDLLAANPSKNDGFREVSGEEVDALVNLTRRALARDPSALIEIVEEAAKGAQPAFNGDVDGIHVGDGPSLIVGGGATVECAAYAAAPVIRGAAAVSNGKGSINKG